MVLSTKRKSNTSQNWPSMVWALYKWILVLMEELPYPDCPIVILPLFFFSRFLIGNQFIQNGLHIYNTKLSTYTIFCVLNYLKFNIRNLRIFFLNYFCHITFHVDLLMRKARLLFRNKELLHLLTIFLHLLFYNTESIFFFFFHLFLLVGG